MKILITGNLGYVGSELSIYLKKKNFNVVGFDSGIFENCILSEEIAAPSVDQQIYCDLRNITTKHIQNIDVIIHLAAISNDPMGNEFEEATNEINYKSTKKLIDLAVKSKVKKFVFASSCSMYGNAKKDKKKIKDEGSILNPLTAYAKSKVLIEKYIQQIKRKKTIFTCLRFSTACGVSKRLRLDLVVNDFVASAICNKKIELLSDGSSWRPLIDVKDMCKAFEWAATRGVIKNESEPICINVGSSKNNILIKDLALLVKKIFRNKVEVNFSKNKVVDDRSYRVDFTKYQKLVPKKFHPIINLKSSIVKIKFFLEANKFLIKDFRNSKYSRLYYLKHLIKQRKISKKITWR